MKVGPGSLMIHSVTETQPINHQTTRDLLLLMMILSVMLETLNTLLVMMLINLLMMSSVMSVVSSPDLQVFKIMDRI